MVFYETNNSIVGTLSPWNLFCIGKQYFVKQKVMRLLYSLPTLSTALPFRACQAGMQGGTSGLRALLTILKHKKNCSKKRRLIASEYSRITFRLLWNFYENLIWITYFFFLPFLSSTELRHKLKHLNIRGSTRLCSRHFVLSMLNNQ